MIKRFGIVLVGIVLVLGIFVYSCQKKGVNDFVTAVHPSPDSSRDLRTVLKNSSFSLFRQAAERVNLDSLLPAGGQFTVFAPVDSAMISAGLDQQHIASLPVDSLREIVLYHIGQGSYGQGTLSSMLYNAEMKSLRKDVTVDRTRASSVLYQQLLYARISGGLLYLNGDPAGFGNDTAWTASNGYIWPIRYVLQAPAQSIWDVVKNRPELSLFYMAMHIDDSIYAVNYLLPLPPFVFGAYLDKTMAGDSINYSYVVYDNLPNTQTFGFNRPTVFAPTNAAFEAIGIYSYQDILNFNSSVPVPGPVTDENTWVTTWYFLPMDTILKNHFILYPGATQGRGAMVPYHVSLYNDLLFNPDINNGVFNSMDFWNLGNSHLFPVPPQLLQFSGNNGTVNINWRTGEAPAALPADRSRHIMALNGAVYEIDKLLYPHN